MSSSCQIGQRLPSQYIAALRIKTMSKSTLQVYQVPASPALPVQVSQALASSSARDDSHPQAIRHRQVFVSCSALHQLNDPKATCRALTLLSHSVSPLFPNSRIPPTVHSTTMHVRMLAILRRHSHGCRIKVFDAAQWHRCSRRHANEFQRERATIESLDMGVFELRCDDRMQLTFTLTRCLPTIDRLEQIQDVFGCICNATASITH
ncbi:hypothetical protein C8F01DRAFT_1106251 [Mycena amicta]|nr:hypothetical protein C8F01DRAFT_1106251 [Mycena amicta]